VQVARVDERRWLAALATAGSPLALVDDGAAKIEAIPTAIASQGPTFGEVTEAHSPCSPLPRHALDADSCRPA
jgi:hypothetical protein